MALEDTKAGDLLARTSLYGAADGPFTVARTTKTQVILKDGSRWRRQDGGRVGCRDPWATTHMVPFTDEHREVIEHRNLAHRLNSVRWRDLPIEKLRKAWAVVS